MLDTIVPSRTRPLVHRVVDAIGAFFGTSDCEAAQRARSAPDADEALIESAAALDGFTGPSNWLGWAGFGMDHIEPIDWRPDADEDGDALEADRSARPRRSAFGD